MKATKFIAILVIIAAIGAGGYYAYAYWRDSKIYFKTENASVTADTVTITPMISGSVQSWDVAEGDEVKSGQVIGRQGLEGLVQTSGISVQGFGDSASAIVSKADIKTPISGKVVQSSVVVGETVAPGMTLAIVADTKNMYIKANVEEQDINRIAVGQPVTIKIDAYPGEQFTGHVESIGEATQSAFSLMPSINTSGTFTKTTQLIPVRINVSGLENYKLRLGYNATVKIKTK